MNRADLELRGSIFEIEICNLLLSKFKDILIVHDKELFCHQIGKKTQIDVIAITKGGIFVIEAKNFHGWIRGNYNDDKWSANSRTKKTMTIYNTLNQNFLHIRALELALENAGIPVNYKIHNLICLPDNTQIYSDVKEITNLSKLYSDITKRFDSKLDIDVNKVTSIIRKM